MIIVQTSSERSLKRYSPFLGLLSSLSVTTEDAILKAVGQQHEKAAKRTQQLDLLLNAVSNNPKSLIQVLTLVWILSLE